MLFELAIDDAENTLCPHHMFSHNPSTTNVALNRDQRADQQTPALVVVFTREACRTIFEGTYEGTERDLCDDIYGGAGAHRRDNSSKTLYPPTSKDNDI